jgi:hypothetical protein
MNCPRCNNEYADNYTQCPACGTQNPTYQQQQTPFTNQPSPLPRPPYPTAVELIKKIGQSKLFLVVAILYTALTAIQTFTSGIQIISVLYVIAIWMFFSESRKNTNPFEMNASSLKTLKTLKTIEIVLSIIAIAGVAIIGLFGLIMDITATEMVLAFCVLIVVFGAICAITLFLLFGIRNYYKSAISAIETGLRPERLSSFAPLWMIVAGILNAALSLVFLLCIPILKDYLVNEMFGNYLDQLTPYLDEITRNSLSHLLSTISSTLIVSSVIGIVGGVCNILIGKLFLDIKKLVEVSYFPSEEEAFYYKREYYAAKRAAEEEAQMRYRAQYRASYQQYQQNNYAQQQYQAPYAQPNGQQYQAPNGQQNGQQYQAPNSQQNSQQNNNNPW